MSLPPIKRIVILFTIAGVVIIGLAAWIFLGALPQLEAARQAVDNHRASIAAIQDQQSNLARLQQQTSSIQALDEQLNQELWTFAHEENFFSVITAIAKTSGVSADDPKIQDVTPTGRPLRRSATITFRGPTASLLKAVSALQKTKPLIGIESITLAPKTASTITLNVQTIWQ